MVILDYQSFVSKVDDLFNKVKEKNSIYFTFKRVYEEKYNYKVNKKNKKLRREDRLIQTSQEDKLYNVLVRAKVGRIRYQTVIKPEELDSFHNILIKIFSLHFIIETNEQKPRVRLVFKKKISNRKKRMLKKAKKADLNKDKEKDKINIDTTDNKK